MRFGLLVGVLLGLIGFTAMAAITTGASRNPDANEPHRVVAVTSMDSLVPVGSTVYVQCQWPDGAYLVDQSIAGSTLVFTVTVGQVDAAPHGPFPESCDDWQARHQAFTPALAVPGSAS